MEILGLMFWAFVIYWFLSGKSRKRNKVKNKRKINEADLRLRKEQMDDETFVGTLGESITLDYLDAKKGTSFYNLEIPGKNGITQIDIVYITDKAVYVIENKNYKGWIFGNDKSKNWTQCLYGKRGKSQKISFYNPIRQNYGHCKSLQALIGENVPIYSIVTFSGDAELKDVTCESKNTYVIYSEQIMNVINDVEKQIDKTIEKEKLVLVLKCYTV